MSEFTYINSKKNRRKVKHNSNNGNTNNDIQICFVFLDDISSHANSIANLDKLCDNGSCKSIYKCKSKTCKLKSNFILRDNVVITSSKRIFDCEVPNETRYIDYDSPNVIYLFT